ncbi:replication-associated recombination protein A [Demequina sp. TTPB684]|uniref:replication-associated recombination protein A n=1 Tax=unclassified Demequina TaxID=2620311 RepID=UPI001CF276B6|nr:MULTISPECIES: replication-associated recombination protein A [unclassified Demequina]MCB2414062.1 replication-associated recombination protein A [Demequina sp. TTPB684]UPU89227.1 replication-associated recombination protein A [Demequina sp. TMPB413]
MDLFDAARMDATGVPAPSASAPLAVRMRPQTLDEVVGQSHLLRDGAPLRRLIGDGTPATSVILWGPPGTGKTTLAYLVAGNRRFVELSAVTAGVKDVRAVIEDSKRRLATGERETVVFIDEIHRFTRSQQDVLLPAVENRWVTLIGATTENPSFSVVGPLLSRSLLLTLKPLTGQDIGALLDRAVADPRGLGGNVSLDDDARAHMVRVAGADARKALTLLESVADAAADNDGVITAAVTEAAMDAALVAYDKSGDQHYDVISAFIKSVRGSDVDAALHYLARMVVAGEDPRFIARRLVILASEDVGLADPQALLIAQAAADAVSFIGMPEGRIPLGEATAYLAMAPKSNRSYMAIDAAIADVRAGKAGVVPSHLRDAHYAGAESLGHGKGYQYSHDAAHGVAAQLYLPESLAGARYYRPTEHGNERALTERLNTLRRLLGREN